jgi:hypothetical protein
MPIPIRGLRTVRTLAGKVGHVEVPHRAHLRIACLEIEKARCITERTSSLRRVAELDSRLQEIETEQTVLLEALAKRKAMHSGEGPGHGARPAARRSGVPFKIRY